MKYRHLGHTGILVSELGYGASPLGGVFGEISVTDGIQAVHTALALGINFLDVSPYYGLTRAETVLGKALEGIPRDSYCLATKVGRYGEDQFDFSAERVTCSVEESLRRLQTDHVDLIQCHDIEYGSLNQIVSETIPALQKIVEQGKSRFIGITGLPLRIFPSVLDQIHVDSILSYCRYTIMNNSLSEKIPYLKEKGVGIIAAAPLCMGLLGEGSLPDWHPADEQMRKACSQAAKLCKLRGTSLPQLAIQFALSNSDIDTTIVGTAKVAEIKNCAAWIEEGMDTELLAEVRKILEPIGNRLWSSGRPENND